LKLTDVSEVQFHTASIIIALMMEEVSTSETSVNLKVTLNFKEVLAGKAGSACS
jgi:hypothetical protein